MGNKCCTPAEEELMKVAILPDPTEFGGHFISDLESEDPFHMHNKQSPPHSLPPTVIKIDSNKDLGKIPSDDVESLASGASSNSSEFMSPKQSLPHHDPDLTDQHSETPMFNDHSEPPTLDVSESITADTNQKRGKQVSFADVACDMEKHGFFGDTPRGSSLMTPSLRSVRSTGELPSTPSIDQIYFQNQAETKASFYSKGPTGFNKNRSHSNYLSQPSPRSDVARAKFNSPGTMDAMDIPMSVRSQGTLPPTPLMDSLFLADVEGSSENSMFDEPQRVLYDTVESVSEDSSDSLFAEPQHILYDVPESDTDSTDNTIVTPSNKSRSETATSSIGGDEFMTSKAWFTTAKASTPSSGLSFS